MKETIRIKGQGHTQTMVFEKGASRCGGAINGIPYHITDKFSSETKPGGVLMNEDVALMVKHFTEHLQRYAPELLAPQASADAQ